MDVKSSVMGVFAGVMGRGVSFGEAGKGMVAAPSGVSAMGDGGRGIATAVAMSVFAASAFGRVFMVATLDDELFPEGTGLLVAVSLSFG